MNSAGKSGMKAASAGKPVKGTPKAPKAAVKTPPKGYISGKGGK